MRNVIASAFVSLDGVMQAPGGPEEDPTSNFKYGGWVWPYFDETSGAVLDEIFARPYDLLLGRKTYEIFAAYWPYQSEDGPNAEITRGFNKATKYVASRSGVKLTWQNSVAIPDAASGVARLKREDGADLLIQGSANLIQTLLAHDLIDRFTLFVFPVVLGTGKQFFEDGARSMALKLEKSITSPAGVTMNTYTPAGAVKTGSMGPDNPSDLEKARREKWKRED
jgi:dihydrofolate reductase